MLTAQDVISAYRLMLGRDPESPAVVQNYVAHSNFDHLRTILLGSGEFAERVSRDPKLLAVPMVALTMTAEVCRYQSLFESLVSLGLTIRDRSVLIVGDEAASLAGFFVTRQCKVTLAVAEKSVDLFRKTLLARPLHAANISIVSRDLSSPVAAEALGPFDFIYGELPDDNSDAMRAWLDNIAEACTDTLIVTCRTAHGHSEDLFITPSPHNQKMRAIPTKKWVFARLRERFTHVYSPSNVVPESSFLQEEPLSSVKTLTYVASRSNLDSPALTEYLSAPPAWSSGNGTAATRK